MDKRNILKLTRTEGPIHDFSFKPASTDFVLISGFMPAIASLYVNYEKAFDFGKAHRNLSVWSDQGRYLALVGFGNLNGEIDIWDVAERKKVGHCSSHSSSMLRFSPCARKFLTATVTPKLRMDNCYKVWSYTG